MGCFSSKPEETNEPTQPSKDQQQHEQGAAADHTTTGATTETPATTAAASGTPQGIDIDHTDPKLLPSAQCVAMPAELLEKAEPETAGNATTVDPRLLPSAQTIAQPAGFVLENIKKEAAAQQAAAASSSH
ncbi:hypothetical protein FOL47_008797 [Perkinsus chesapeaki]|uniref:Uncharacterized protein n=1 Tax=Perkinsus chesapeaki TaxID=330153 RepID=A0A7J6LBW1_PERCH|nr:hypothetical protein FOL47_008797 [Perkinsus chesapeaki]